MFALEGSLLNAYLLYLAARFRGQRTDEHARAVFRCSLWYLPVLLTSFVFHSRNWGEARVGAVAASSQVEQEEEEEEEGNVILRLRKKLATVCMHEVMIAKQKEAGDLEGGGGSSKGHLCPPVIAGHTKGEVAGVLEGAATAVAAAGGARIVLQTTTTTQQGQGPPKASAAASAAGGEKAAS